MKVPKDRLEVFESEDWGNKNSWQIDLFINNHLISTCLENQAGYAFWQTSNQAKRQAQRFSKKLGNIPVIVVDDSE